MSRRPGALLAGGLLVASVSVAAAVLQYHQRPAGGPETEAVRPACPRTAGLVGPSGPDAPAAVVALGARLFDDRRLSGDGSVSCATCHQRARAFTDGRARAVGIGGRGGRRNTPQLFNLAYSPVFLWDGSAATMEDAIRRALVNPAEMAMSDEAVARTLQGDGPELRRLLGAAPTTASVARAIAAYVASLRTGGSRVDRFLYCGDRSALDEREQAGLHLFAGRAHCVRCHVFEHDDTTPLGGRLALFTDNRFHDVGAGRGDDPGRGPVTGRAEDGGAFKTPTLRNVGLTAPYMHDGSLPTLDAVVDFYNRGGGRRPGVDPSVVPLGLDDRERRDLVAFLEALTSDDSGPATRPAATTAAAGR